MQREAALTLDGEWRFRLDPEDVGEHYRENLDEIWAFDERWMRRDYDDSAWGGIQVPSCWQEAGHEYNGAAWYRRTLPELPADSKMRTWIRFHGVDYFSDVWVNGFYLGSHEGYFDAFEYEISPYVDRTPAVLAVRVDSPQDIRSKERQEWQLKSLLKGALQRWDVNNPLVNPGGIWNHVTLYRTGAGRIGKLEVRPTLRDDVGAPLGSTAPARVMVSGVLDLDEAPARAGEHVLRLSVAPLNVDAPEAGAELTLPPTAGLVPVTLWLELPEARLWYPWDLGEQPLYRLTASLESTMGVSDSVQSTFGIRSILRESGWNVSVNGHRIFQRGANYLSDQFLSRMGRERYATDVALAREANLNTLHPFCVVEKQEFYDECDRQGMLVYQDFPMWLMMSNASELVRRSVGMMERLVGQFGHHPSIFVWNCGSQPSKANFEKLAHALVREARRQDPSRIAHQANALLDYVDIQGVIRRNPVGDFHWSEETAEAYATHYDWRVDTHQYFGWYYERELSDLDRVPARYLELVTEYGAQALPDRAVLESIVPSDRRFPPHWPSYAVRCFQRDEQLRYIPEPPSLEAFIASSQEYQARFIQYHTEYYRRHRFAPCNGAHLFCFNDCWPAITWSVVDYERNPKLGYEALRRAMAPVQCLADLPYRFAVGTAVAFGVYLVNDTSKDQSDVVCTWWVEVDGHRTARGEHPADAAAGEGVMCIGDGEIPPVDSAEVTVRLELTRRSDTAPMAKNRYTYRRTDEGGYERRWA
jgi:beta-mannosidase